MKRIGKVSLAFYALMVCALPLFALAQDKAEEKKGKKVKEIKSLKDASKKKLIDDVAVRNEKGAIWPGGKGPEKTVLAMDSSMEFADPVRQLDMHPLPQNPVSTLTAQFQGIGYNNVVPPDPTVAVGPNHIMQMTNGTSGSLFRVTDKQGNVLIGPTFMDQVTGYGGFGDPIALYDHLAGRFVIMEMVNAAEVGSYGLSFAVSRTADPTGAWDAYFFSTGTALPDFPKLAMWPDGYYVTANEFTNASSYAGTFVYAVNRQEMLNAVASPTFVRLRLGLLNRNISACPVTFQGNVPPGAALPTGLLAWMQDDTWTTWIPDDTDSVGLSRMVVNWSNPSASFIAQNLASLGAASFKSNICTTLRSRCIPQPGTPITLEALDQKVMNQPMYRIFDGYEGVVMTHTTDAGNQTAGIRWYELRKPAGAGNWTVANQSTYAPDATHRFMPSIAYNQRGDIGLVYNVSDGVSTFPGLRYTGRRQCDPPNLMTISEETIVAGGGASGGSRFGDYNHIVHDPSNGSFWVTGEYMPTFLWSTWVANFSFDSCLLICGGAFNLSSQHITPQAATVRWTKSSGTNQYEVAYKSDYNAEWVNAGITTADSMRLTGLTPGKLYQWSVRGVCNFGVSQWANASFATPVPPCAMPAGTNTTQVAITAAQCNWLPVADAVGYDLEWKRTQDPVWQLVSLNGANTVSYALTGLAAGTAYEWRLRTRCAFSNSDFTLPVSFTTQPEIILCPPPAGLQTSDITAGSAQLNWQPVAGATSYRVEFQRNGTTTWTVATASTTANTWFLGGLTAVTAYTWRVQATCPNNVTAFSQASFTTTSACTIPGSLTTTNITSGSATLNWGSVKSVVGYRAEYRAAGTGTWISSANTTARTLNLTGLTPQTTYQWRVRTICSGGTSAPTAIQQFTTQAPPCPDPYEPNNSKTALAAIPTGTDIFAAIGAGTDQDWYSFTNTAATPNIRVVLSQLPANYSITLLSSAGRELVKAARSGTVDETISYNTTVVGTWWLRVFPASTSVFDPSRCYKLRVNLQAGTNAPEPDNEEMITMAASVATDAAVISERAFDIFPNPVRNGMRLKFGLETARPASITITAAAGQPIWSKNVAAIAAGQTEEIQTANWKPGLYIAVLRYEGGTATRKFLVIP